jgi:hypothetical protein
LVSTRNPSYVHFSYEMGQATHSALQEGVAHGLTEPTESQMKAIMQAKAKVAAKRKGLPAPSEMPEPCSLEMPENDHQNCQAHPSYLDLEEDWHYPNGEATTSELCGSHRSSKFGSESPIRSFATLEKARQTATSPLHKSDCGDQQNKRYLPFACLCEQIFPDMKSLTDHIRLTEGYVHQCSSCLAAFRTPGLARKHVHRSIGRKILNENSSENSLLSIYGCPETKAGLTLAHFAWRTSQP